MGTLGRKAVWGAALALAVLIPAGSASASSGSGKLDKLLKEAGPGAQQVIIRYRADANVDDIKHRVERHRGRVVSRHKLIAAISAVVNAADIAALLADDDVLSVSADADVSATAATDKKPTATSTTSNAGDYGTVSSLKHALGLQDWFTGSSVTVAVIDSGIQNSLDFTGRIAGMYDFTPGKNGAGVIPSDEYGHGTHVAGLIGSNGVSSAG